METRQVYLIQTEGPDGLESTEVVITDLGEIGEDAIVVFEEAVGVGAEETVAAGSYSIGSCSNSSNGSFDSGGAEEILSDGYLETGTDCMEVSVGNQRERQAVWQSGVGQAVVCYWAGRGAVLWSRAGTFWSEPV